LISKLDIIKEIDELENMKKFPGMYRFPKSHDYIIERLMFLYLLKNAERKDYGKIKKEFDEGDEN
jgi:hypothetical protein